MKTEFLSLAWTQFWQVTCLALAVAIVARLFARNRPHLAFLLWVVVLLKCITPPIFSNSAGVFCWLQAKTSKFEKRFESAGESTLLLPTEVDVNDADFLSRPQLPREIARNPIDAPVHEKPAFDAMQMTILALPIIWLLGGFALLGFSAIRCRRCLAAAYSKMRDPSPGLQLLFSDLIVRLGIRRQVRLVVTESLIGPAVVGVVRPTVLLPAAIVDTHDLTDLEPILAHELVHVRRGDLWVGMLQVLTTAVWWFHPLVRLISRWATLESERCCDEEVIGELGLAPGRYARSLLRVMEVKQTLRAVPVFPGIRPVDVTAKRLERVMKLGQGCHKRTPRWCWIIALLATVITLPGGALLLSADEPKSASTLAKDDTSMQSVTTTGNVDTKLQFRVYFLESETEAIDKWQLPWQSAGRPLKEDSVQSKVAKKNEAETFQIAIAPADDAKIEKCVSSASRDQRARFVSRPSLAILPSKLVFLWEGIPIKSVDAEGRRFTTSVTEKQEFEISSTHKKGQEFELQLSMKNTMLASITKRQIAFRNTEQTVEVDAPNFVEIQSAVAVKVAPRIGAAIKLSFRNHQGKTRTQIIFIERKQIDEDSTTIFPSPDNSTLKQPTNFGAVPQLKKDISLSPKRVVESPKGQPANYFIKVYPVADILSRNGSLKLGDASGLPLDGVHSAEAGLDELILSIQRRIEPGSWVVNKGDGELQGVAKTLALVVTQTQSNHDKVAKFLTELRTPYLKQNALRCKIFNEVSDAAIEKLELSFQSISLSKPNAEFPPNSIREAFVDAKTAEKIAATLGNVNAISSSNGERPLSFLEMMIGRKNPVRLMFTANSAPSLTMMEVEFYGPHVTAEPDKFASVINSLGHRSYLLAKGSSLLLEVRQRDEATVNRAPPILGNLPVISRLFTDQLSGPRILILITPTE